MSFGLPRYHIAPNIYSMRKLRSSAAERHVGYLGAKQQPCSEKYPTFDVGPPLPENICGCEEDCALPEATAHEIHEVHRICETVKRHSDEIHFLRGLLQKQIECATSGFHLESDQEYQEGLDMWTAAVQKLASKTESWSLEIRRLEDQIRDWLKDVLELEGASEGCDG
ncbi:MAG: hypothetical protein LQ346_007493 [Caloplaca aetnensis]|nr:MAG: hypothetical protein LQ346_007493 [Caloplaca aetnensis]